MSSRINSAFPIQAIHYVADILWDRDPKPRRFDGYEVVFHEGFADFHDTFDRYLERHDLTRMVAGYAWKWVTKNDHDDPNLYDIEIDGLKIRWNCQQENWVGLGVDNPEVAHEMGVIHSIQGYDLSYAFVVIGPDLSYDESAEKIVVNRASYFDANGNPVDSGKNASDFATAAQGSKADSAIQGVKVNGTTVTPDGNKVVDIEMPERVTAAELATFVV